MAAQSPLCFVLMPFGRKAAEGGLVIDFAAVYAQAIRPAIADAGLEPLRADDDMTGGIIHRPMFERLILCPFAVADLTTANANVFYELGVRHAVRPSTTVLLFAEGRRLPFDVAALRAVPYRLNPDGSPADAASARAAVAGKLSEARKVAAQQDAAADTPIFQLVENFPDIQRLKTDVFRDRVDYARKPKDDLAAARRAGLDAVAAFEKSLGTDLGGVESGVLIDLLLSYRTVNGWPQMIALAARLPRPLAQTVMVQEQLALALNRAGRDEEAETVLNAVLASRGPSSETYAILGRVYKDRYDRAKQAGKTLLARGELQKAIDTYLKGFESDWRDAYPGVNAATLMELREPPDPRGAPLVPIVTYAAERRIAAGKPDYWDYATLVELAVLGRDEPKAVDALASALPAVREKWEPESTLRNIKLIAEARRGRGETVAPWVQTVMDELGARAK